MRRRGNEIEGHERRREKRNKRGIRLNKERCKQCEETRNKERVNKKRNGTLRGGNKEIKRKWKNKRKGDKMIRKQGEGWRYEVRR